ncbi:hypothetical protein EV682_103302 [Iodobacter fluviatilis]|uniref:Uncharacterized protein n=1 Tax=Iodobacter fluviatilis TaxID=537 RepID=A0A377QBG7_9NEIS|nr:hypothetical protein EV682_103302 [Iodobacter fluviatilis]STQ91211.1 Uncharacterised protein [Iodobacter fluviatilis]
MRNFSMIDGLQTFVLHVLLRFFQVAIKITLAQIPRHAFVLLRFAIVNALPRVKATHSKRDN